MWNRCHFVLHLYLALLFDPKTNKLKYCFKNIKKMFKVAAMSAGRSMEGQQTIILGLILNILTCYRNYLLVLPSI